jgi:hypothetical protein
MTIKDAGYQLCRRVKESMLREQIATLLLSLNISKPGHGRGTFGYYARSQRAQVMGYLIIDQQRDQLNAESPHRGIPPLEDDERIFLASVQKQITDLNRRCIEPLTEALPDCARAVDPYNRFAYVEPPDIPSIDFISKDSTSELVSQFQEHPALSAVLKCVRDLDEALTPDHFLSDVLEMTESIMKLGPLEGPDNLYDYRRSKGDNRSVHTLLMTALLCLRDSLSNLNQLLFQSIFTDKLIFLDQTNIIDLGPRISHSTSYGVTLVCQNIGRSMLDMILLNPRFLLLLDGEVIGVPHNLLLRIENFRERTTSNSGRTVQLELRNIDDHLNSFPFLLL